MPQRTHQRGGTLALSVISVLATPAGGAGAAYHLLKEIPAGGDGGWDDLTVDETGRRLHPTVGVRVNGRT